MSRLLGIIALLFGLFSVSTVSAIPVLSQMPINSSIDLCTDSSLDAAVSLTEAHILLFKGPFMWVLNLLEYQLDLIRANNYLIDACLAPDSPKELMDYPYYIWNRHGDFQYYRNQICIDRADRVCQLSLDMFNPTNGAFQARTKKMPLASLATSDNKKDTCYDNLEQGNSIEMMLSSKVYFRRTPLFRSAVLIGKYFKALISYNPAHPYDTSMVIFKLKLVKFDREVNSIGDGACSVEGVADNAAMPDFCLTDVRTFSVQRNGELVVFFAQQFCYLEYLNFKCVRRNLQDLFGCTTPRENFIQNHVSILQAEYHPITSVRIVPEPPNSTEAPGPSTVEPVILDFPSSTAVARSVVGDNRSSEWDSSGVSTLAPTTAAAAAAPVTSDLAQTTTHSPVSLSTISERTGANVTTTSTPSGAVSTDSHVATTGSSAVSVKDGIASPGDNLSSSPKPYDVDFLYRKREAFKRSLPGAAAAAHEAQLLLVWPNFIRIGLFTSLHIFMRALASFLLVVLIFCVLSSLVLYLLHCFSEKFNFKVMILILKSLFVQKLSFY